MPLPRPNKNEKEDDFISRCMSSETIKKDFETQDQRLAVCYNQWKRSKKENSEEEDELGLNQALAICRPMNYKELNSIVTVEPLKKDK